MQRYYCTHCAKSYSESQPLDNLRVDHDKAVSIINCLCEGVGVRSTARLLNCHRDTVLSVLETIGAKCVTFLDRKLRDIPMTYCQLDELWAKVGCRQCRTTWDDPENGDFYTFLALDGKSKLIGHYYTGKRTQTSADEFLAGLASRVKGRPQITSDGWRFYRHLVLKHFWGRTDFAMQSKTFAEDPNSKGRDTVRRYSPPVCTGVVTDVIAGNPNRKRITNSHLERCNLSVRTFNRRFTRLCLGYSKKLRNHRLSVALFVAHYNWVKKHSTIGTTPAVARGLADRPWTTAELVQAMCETF